MLRYVIAALSVTCFWQGGASAQDQWEPITPEVTTVLEGNWVEIDDTPTPDEMAIALEKCDQPLAFLRPLSDLQREKNLEIGNLGDLIVKQTDEGLVFNRVDPVLLSIDMMQVELQFMTGDQQRVFIDAKRLSRFRENGWYTLRDFDQDMIMMLQVYPTAEGNMGAVMGFPLSQTGQPLYSTRSYMRCKPVGSN